MDIPDKQRLTKSCLAALDQAAKSAASQSCSAIGPHHILSALLHLEHSVGAELLRLAIPDIEQHLSDVVLENNEVTQADPHVLPSLSRESLTLLQSASHEASQLQHMYIGTEHIVLAVFANPDLSLTKALCSRGITGDDVRTVAYDLLGSPCPQASEALQPMAVKLTLADFPPELRDRKRLRNLLKLQDSYTDDQYQESPMVELARRMKPQSTSELTRLLVDLHIQTIRPRRATGDVWLSDVNWEELSGE